MSYKPHKKRSPILKRFQTNSRPTSPAPPLGTTVTSASVQSLPLEQPGLVPSTDPQVSVGPDVAGSPHRPWHKRIFSRSGSPASRHDMPSKLTQSQAELGQDQSAPAISAENIPVPKVVSLVHNEIPTGRNNHTAGATSLDADKEARLSNAASQEDNIPPMLTQLQCASTTSDEDIPGPNIDKVSAGRINRAASTTSPDVDTKPQRTKAAVTWAVVKDTLQAVADVSDVFPPLKSATVGVLTVIKRFEAVEDNQEQFSELKMKLDLLIQLLDKYKDNVTPSICEWMKGLAHTLENKSAAIKTMMDGPYRTKLLDSTFNKRFVQEQLQSLTCIIDIILVQTSLEANTTVTNTNITVIKMFHNTILDKVGYVSGSDFDSENNKGCLEGTRVMLLADILMWATDPASPHVFWLNGMAGTGKTTVTESFCSILHRKKNPGASFFCSRHEGRVDIHQIFPSLARGLARRYPSFKMALIKTLEQDIDPVGLSLQKQYQTLILQPAEDAFKGSSEPIILSVDALDECEDAAEITEKFLKAIMDNVPSVTLKFFLAGRPEMALRTNITSASGSQILRLHEIEDHIVERDIELYLNKQLYSIEELREKYTPWPPSELKAIVKRAGKLFIYASTAYKYISYWKGNPCDRLEELASSTQPLAVKGVDELYTIILNAAFSDLVGREKKQIQTCLSSIICAQRPMSAAVCGKLLSITSKGVMKALISLHAVLQVPENNDENERITLYHASFFDFVTSKDKSGTEPWFIDIRRGHSELAGKCLSIMNQELCFNIAGATTSYKSNVEQDLKISAHLQYVCTAWGDHFLLSADENGQLSKQLIERTENFLEEKFLYWLEVLSVNEMVTYGSRTLYRLSKVCYIFPGLFIMN
ncbi:hypothetical protein BDQ12DRAFT_764135 [Crucibulum laeve]|uniref:Nephrocystin 3-like N-terminal domain-containing protein n=1 Tax=Crucibulum laeve TaxID=68775 RepID=A0A5C3LNM1_9AGAR|nr:hypothetical protein BDQ12DRAFT_764135 [Crucibulum laeve]